MDADYVNDLNEDEKDWYNQFNEEYYGAALDFKNLKNNMHNTKELKKDCTDRNNARNRCRYGIAKARKRVQDARVGSEDPTVSSDEGLYSKSNTLLRIDPDERITSSFGIEDSLIEYIDSKRELPTELQHGSGDGNDSTHDPDKDTAN